MSVLSATMVQFEQVGLSMHNGFAVQYIVGILHQFERDSVNRPSQMAWLEQLCGECVASPSEVAGQRDLTWV